MLAPTSVTVLFCLLFPIHDLFMVSAFSVHYLGSSLMPPLKARCAHFADLLPLSWCWTYFSHTVSFYYVPSSLSYWLGLPWWNITDWVVQGTEIYFVTAVQDGSQGPGVSRLCLGVWTAVLSLCPVGLCFVCELPSLPFLCVWTSLASLCKGCYLPGRTLIPCH